MKDTNINDMVFTLRMDVELRELLDKLSKKTMRSCGELVRVLIYNEAIKEKIIEGEKVGL